MSRTHICSLIRDFDSVCKFCFNIDVKDKSASFKKCFEMAWKDCAQGYRYIGISFKSKKENVFNTINNYIKENKNIVPIDLIEEVKSEFSFKKCKRTEFGAAQKIVNMLLKYLFLYQEFAGIEKFALCNLDCPLDSVILSWVDGYEDAKWTYLRRKEYDEIQDKIDAIISKSDNTELINLNKKCGKLAFDFVHWPNKRNK